MNLEDNRKPTGPRVLHGVKVLDFSCVISGPYCTRMMADLGAEVLKIEPPGGELLRAAPPHRNGASKLFSQLNAGKRCITLDLKSPSSIDVVKRLVADVDVVVENFSPGVMNRLGIDYPALRECNERLIMCSISGFGQTGPDASRPAFAPIVQAWSGYDAVTLHYQPTIDKPLNMGLPVADNVASLQAFGAISAALFYREKTGVGQYIDIAMFDALLGTMQKDFQIILEPNTFDRIYGPISTTDGFVLMMLISPRHFEALADLIGQPELKTDPRFSTTPERLNHYAELMEIAAVWAKTRTSLEVLDALKDKHIPVSRYREIAETIDDPQLLHRNMMAETTDSGGPLRVPNSPFLFSATHAAIQPWVADIGQHNEAVFRDELGLDPTTLNID
ncbi:MAG: CoA:oxalate CoA-transferase [Gammaproteobacteria bacterium]|jgi:CoA:oxalate CoA-transferase